MPKETIDYSKEARRILNGSVNLKHEENHLKEFENAIRNWRNSTSRKSIENMTHHKVSSVHKGSDLNKKEKSTLMLSTFTS